MTLRQRLGGDAHRIHELVDRLLDGEDSLIVLMDGRRAVSYGEGFGLSPCQLELVTIEIERALRAAGGTAAIKSTERRRRSEQIESTGERARILERVGGDDVGYGGGLADGGSARGWSDRVADGNRGIAPRPLLRLASTCSAGFWPNATAVTNWTRQRRRRSCFKRVQRRIRPACR
jgi:hypothetical protein